MKLVKNIFPLSDFFFWIEQFLSGKVSRSSSSTIGSKRHGLFGIITFNHTDSRKVQGINLPLPVKWSIV